MSSPLLMIDKTQQVKALFAKFDQINDPQVSSFTASIPEMFEDAVARVQSSKILVSDFVLRNRIALAAFVRKFHHDAGTLTASVENSIAVLGDPTTRIVVSTHQPNLFAYGGIFRKIVLLETLKNSVEKLDRNKKIVNLFLIVDHDFIDESWIRLAQLPSMQHSSGVMELRLPVSESRRWQMVCNTPVPGQAVLDNWKRQLKLWIKKSDSGLDKKILNGNLELFWQQVQSSHSRAKSYADLNSFLMSKIVNEMWNYSTLFVRLSEISPVFENGFTFLISNFGIYSDTLRRTERMFIKHNIDTGVSSSSHVHAPVWVHCNCGSKAPTKIINADDGLALVGICMSCKKDLRLSLGSPDDPDLSKAIRDVSPRAIPIPLLLSRDLGISCYASGTGGLGYLVDGSVIGKRLGIDFPPVLVWPSRDIYSGIGQAEAIASIRAMEIKDIDAHLEILRRRSKTYEERIMPLLAERSEKTSIGEPVDKLLAQLFTLKEEQRKIRRHISTVERIRNAVSISPCIVDYAVNFGIVTAEKTWRNHLEHNGNLSSHVQFSQT